MNDSVSDDSARGDKIWYGRIRDIRKPKDDKGKDAIGQIDIDDYRDEKTVTLDFSLSKILVKVFEDVRRLDMPLVVRRSPADDPRPQYFGSLPFIVESFVEDISKIVVSFVGVQKTATLSKDNTNIDDIRDKLIQSRDQQATYWFVILGFGFDKVAKIADVLFEVKTATCKAKKPHRAVFDERLHRPVSVKKAHKLFRKIEQLSTDPLNGKLSGIPFLYVSTGCQYRSHAMCRELLSLGVAPMKAWAFAGQKHLAFATPNHLTCKALWEFHCAAAVLTKEGVYVIDPSTMNKAVPIQEWYGQLQNTGSKLYVTSHHVLNMSIGQCNFTSDPEYELTDFQLTVYRINLRLLSILLGAPPFSHCTT